MDVSADGKLARRIASKTEQLGQLVARRLLRERREAMLQRAAGRRLAEKRRAEFGSAVVMAGCGDWHPAEIIGVLMDARDRIGSSTTQRLGMRKRGEAALGTAASTVH